MTEPPRPDPEVWVKVADLYKIHVTYVYVYDGYVRVDNTALDAVVSGGVADADRDTEGSWMVTYPVISELLTNEGFRKWEAV